MRIVEQFTKNMLVEDRSNTQTSTLKKPQDPCPHLSATQSAIVNTKSSNYSCNKTFLKSLEVMLKENLSL